MNHEIQMWSISSDIHASKLCNWSDQPSRWNWPGSEHRGLTVKNLFCLGRVTTSLSILQKKGGDVWVNGVRVFKS